MCAYLEVNTEGDYNDHWNDTTYPTPKTPSDDWDYYALNYGYAYRGQPSLVWKVTFQLDGSSTVAASTAMPAGRSSWDAWNPQYGQIEGMTTDKADPAGVSLDVANSGVARLRADDTGARFSVSSVDLPPGTVQPTKPPRGNQRRRHAEQRCCGYAAATSCRLECDDVGGRQRRKTAFRRAATRATRARTRPRRRTTTAARSLTMRWVPSTSSRCRPIRITWSRGAGRGFTCARRVPICRCTRTKFASRAIRSSTKTVSSAPGRQAKGATESKEGATLLTLPASVPAGEVIEATIGDLEAQTHYYVGVRATDIANRQGPLRIAEVTTTRREFATVTPCFIATAAYGSPLASEVGVLRQLRDRYLSPQVLGRGFVAAYYGVGGRFAAWLAPHPQLRAAVRGVVAAAGDLGPRARLTVAVR